VKVAETDLEVLRRFALEIKGSSYVCELGPEHSGFRGKTTLTIEGTFFFDETGRLIPDAELAPQLDDLREPFAKPGRQK
jgi:hypothetical protein